MANDPVYDSPTGWVARHIQEYVATDGRRGHRWSGVSTLLLTSKGRTTGKLRRTALIYGIDQGNYIVVGSNGGSDRHPQWYVNLTAEPMVGIQVASDRLRGRATTAAGSERQRLWTLMTDIWPDYGRYDRTTSREIPVVVITPILPTHRR